MAEKNIHIIPSLNPKNEEQNSYIPIRNDQSMERSLSFNDSLSIDLKKEDLSLEELITGAETELKSSERKKARIEDIYDETKKRGINEESVTIKAPYEFIIGESYKARVRKVIKKKLEERIVYREMRPHGNINFCYPCIKPMEERMLDDFDENW